MPKENAKDFSYDYMCLSRMQQDCRYFIEHPSRKHLMMLTVEDQISEMKKLYERVPEKPEWLSMEDINLYAAKMTEIDKSLDQAKAIEPAIVRNRESDLISQRQQFVIMPLELRIAGMNRAQVSWALDTFQGFGAELQFDRDKLVRDLFETKVTELDQLPVKSLKLKVEGDKLVVAKENDLQKNMDHGGHTVVDLKILRALRDDGKAAEAFKTERAITYSTKKDLSTDQTLGM